MTEITAEVMEAHTTASSLAWQHVTQHQDFSRPGFSVATTFFETYENIYGGLLERFARIGGLAMAVAPDWYTILENYIGENDTIKITGEDEDPLNQRNAVLTIEITRALPPEAVVEVTVEPEADEN